MIPRSWLFVPGDSERKLARARESGADAVIVDLEDSVVPERKALAREMTVAFLMAPRLADCPALWVRVNPVSSGLMPDDLAAVMRGAPAGIVLPKPDSIADVQALDEALAGLERSTLGRSRTPVMAIATETALAVTNLAG